MNLSMYLIGGTALMGVMGVASIVPILPTLALKFNLSGEEIGLLITAFTLPSAFVSPLAGVVADRIGRRPVLITGLLFFALGGVLCALSDSLFSLVVGRAVQGLGAAPLGVLYGTLVGDLYPPAERAKRMGQTGAILSIGTAIYPAIGGALGEIHWALPFWMPLMGLFLILLACRVPLPHTKNTVELKAYIKSSSKIVMQGRVLGVLLLTFICFSMLYGPSITYFPMLADLLFKSSPSEIGFVFSLASLGTAVVAMNLGRILKKYSGRQVLLGASVFYLLGQVLMLVLAGLFHSIWFLVLPVFLGGVAQGMTFPFLGASLTSLAPTSNRAVVMSINGTVLRLSQSFAPLFFGLGWMFWSWPGPYILGIGVSIIFALLTLKIFGRENNAS